MTEAGARASYLQHAMTPHRCAHLARPEDGRVLLAPHGGLYALCLECAHRLLDVLMACFPPERWAAALTTACIPFHDTGETHDQ